jgi:hypothetical protein
MKKVEPDYTYLKFYNIEQVPLKMSELIHKGFIADPKKLSSEFQNGKKKI